MTGWLQWELPPEAGGSGCRRKSAPVVPPPPSSCCSAFASRGKTKRPKGLLCFQHLAPYAHLYPGIEQWAWILQLCSAYTHMHTTYSKCPTSAQSWVLSWDRGRQSWQKSRYSVHPWHWLDSIFSLLLKLRGRHEASTGCHRDASATPRQTLFHWVTSWPHFAFPGGRMMKPPDYPMLAENCTLKEPPLRSLGTWSSLLSYPTT